MQGLSRARIPRIQHSHYVSSAASHLTRRSAFARAYSSGEPNQTKPENEVQDSLEQPLRRGHQLPPHYHIAHPNLADLDPQLDSAKVKVFPPSPKNPFVNRVTFRNTEQVQLPPNEESRISASAQKAAEGEDEMQQINSADVDLKLHLPLSLGEINNLYQFPLYGRRITKQTGKGKIHRMHQLIVVGNGDGLVGYGEGKDLMDPQRAKEKALIQAVRSMDRVERFEKRTIFGEMSTKMGSTKIILRPRPVGFGLQCNPKIHQVLKAAGIKDISAKVWGSRNPINVIKALFRVLHSGNQPAYMGDGIGGKGRRTFKGEPIQSREAVERARGRRMADLRT